MKIKILIESKILLEYIKARKNGFKDSYSDFVTNYISKIIDTENETKIEIMDMDNSVYKLTTLYREHGEYFRDSKVYYLERPNGMNQNEVYKVIAHNREYYEKFYSNFDKSICELTNNALVNVYGFNQIQESDAKDRPIVELFFLKEYDMYFINSPWFDRHFFWYEKNKGILEEDIFEIYDRIDSNISRKLRNGE